MNSMDEYLSRRVRETISNMSDEDLLKMLDVSARNYTPYALDIARQELSKRGGKEMIRQRLAEKQPEAVLVQIEVPQRKTNIMKAVRKTASGWDYTLFEGQEPVAYIDVYTSWWGDVGKIFIKESVYKSYRILNGEFSDDLVLEYADSILARAQDAVFTRSFKISFNGKRHTLKPSLPLFRSFYLFRGGRRIGSIFPEYALGNNAEIDLPIAIPLPVCAFIFWLVVLAWNKWDD